MAFAEKTPSVKRRSKLPRVYYATQIEVRPPTIVLFVNDPDLFDDNYRRFLVNRFRQLLPFAEVPIQFFVRCRREGGAGRKHGPVRGRAEAAAAKAATGAAADIDPVEPDPAEVSD
jgi:hypothetical protein